MEAGGERREMDEEWAPRPGLSDIVRRMEARRPAEAAPPELWAVVGLLALAGLLLVYQTVPRLPNFLRLAFSSDPFSSLGLFFVVILVEIALLGVVLLALAYSLYCGDPSARLIALVLAGSLGVSLLFRHGRTSSDTWVMACSFVIVAALSLSSTTRAWFHDAETPEPPVVTAARAISIVLAIALGMVGVALLPAASAKGSLALIGIALCVATVVILRTVGAIREGDPNARNLLSVMMAGYVVLLLLTSSEASADTLTVGVALAVAVIGLLWLPPVSYEHFGAEPGEAARTAAQFAHRMASATQAARRPSPAPRVARLPVQRVVHDTVGIAEGSQTARSSRLGLTYDQRSWFPIPDPDEHVVGAFLVTMLLFGAQDQSEGRVFQGTSTLLISDRRLSGVCPKGNSEQHGALDAARGPVIVWSLPRVELSARDLATSASGSYLSLSRAGHSGPWALLARPRILDGDAFRACDIQELMTAVGPAQPTAPSTPVRQRETPPREASPRQPRAEAVGASSPVHSGPMVLTAKNRAKTALVGTTALSGQDALAIVKTAASGVKGGGTSLLTSGLRNIGAQVNVEAETPTAVRFSLTSGKRLVNLCSFAAAVSPVGRRTEIRLGGLERYRTTQERLFGVIPAGPKKILGMAPYKQFLNLAAEMLLEADPSADLAVSSVP